jgi:VanZ family protein
MKISGRILAWLPAVALMTAIFILSSIPSQEMPSFGLWDLVVKKGAHMLGYGLLALAYWLGIREERKWWLAILLAIVYALSDEYHQSFVPGRHPSLVDALVIDAAGAISAVCLGRAVLRRWGKKSIG